MLNVLCYLNIRGQYFITMPCENYAKYREFQSVNTLATSFWTNWEDNIWKIFFDIPTEYLMDLWHHFKYHRMASKVCPTNQTQTEPQAPKVMNQSLWCLNIPSLSNLTFFFAWGVGNLNPAWVGWEFEPKVSGPSSRIHLFLLLGWRCLLVKHALLQELGSEEKVF